VDTIIALQRLASPALDRVMLLVTGICSQEAFTVLLVLAFLAVDATFGRRLGIVFLTGAYLNDVIKTLVDAPRPFQARPDVLRPGAAVTAPGSSFPSGHTQSAVIFWTLAALQFKRAWFWALAGLIVAAVGLSRVYLGVHYPVDVLGGLAVGLLVVAVAQFARRLAFAPGKAVVVVLGLLVPLGVHLLFTTDASHVFLAVASAFIVGPELVTHRAGGGVITRLGMGVVGVVLVAAVLSATSSVMPEELKHAPLPGYLRYLVIGLTGTVLAPLVCRWARLSGGPVVATGGARRA
jgi:membrane-associated phospholipid phosphatase